MHKLIPHHFSCGHTFRLPQPDEITTEMFYTKDLCPRCNLKKVY